MEAEIVLGVVTGVFSSALIWLVKYFWTSHVDPYLVQIRYKGLDISGPWTAISIEADSAVRFQIDIKQDGYNISGTCILEYYSATNEYRMPQSITGELWEGYVSLRFKAIERTITSYSVGLLKVAGGGIGLAGSHLFRDINNEAVDRLEITFVRGTGNPRVVIQFNEAAARLQARYLESEAEGSPLAAVADAAPDMGGGADHADDESAQGSTGV